MWACHGEIRNVNNYNIQVRSNRCMRYFVCLLGVLWGICGSVAFSAGADGTRFVRIHAMSDVVPGNYLIGAFSRVSSSAGLKSYLMSSVLSNHKCKAVFVELSGRESVTDVEANCIWQLQKADDGKWHILSSDAQLGLAVSETTDLELTSSYSDWDIRLAGDGVFKISDGTQRCIGLNTVSSGVYFGRYLPQVVDTVCLALYQEVEQTNSSFIPQWGDTVALATKWDGSPFAYCSADSLCDVGDFLTVSNQLAYGAPSCNYIIEPCAEAKDSTFSLRTIWGTYLKYSGKSVLCESEIPQPWGIDAMSLFTFSGKDTVRLYAKANSENHLLLTCQPDGFGVGLLRCCSTPASITEFKPHCVELRGACSMAIIDSLLQNGRFRAFDFSAADLPQRFRSMNYSFSGSNRLFYCQEKQVISLPEGLGNVVAGEEGKYNAVGPITWIDRIPLSIPYPFGVNGKTVKYVRNVYLDGGWETVYLPFACSNFPNNFHFEQYVGRQGQHLIFKPATEIKANVPYVFRYTGVLSSEAVAEFTLMADNGQILSSESAGWEYVPMWGTYEDVCVDNSSVGKVYFLNEEGSNFVRAAAGSTLNPFRLYLKFGNEITFGQIYHIKIETGINSVTELDQSTTIYDLYGRRMEQRPCGFYIQNGHKMYNLK